VAGNRFWGRRPCFCLRYGGILNRLRFVPCNEDKFLNITNIALILNFDIWISA